MAVTLKRGLWSYVRKYSDSFWLQLATDDDERAAAALERAIEAILAVPHPDEPDEPAASYVSDVVVVPGGPVVSCDFKDLPSPILRSALDAVVASLEADGIEGTLQPPPSPKDAPFWTVLADGHHTPPYPTGWALLVVRDKSGAWPSALPAPWTESLSTWALEASSDDDLFWAAIVSMAFRMPTTALRTFLARPLSVAGVVTGDHRDRLRHININGSHIVVSERGPSVQGDALDRSAERLRALAREMAPHSEYVALDFPAARTKFGRHEFPMHQHHFGTTPRICVPGAYPWQILTRTHADALDHLPPDATWLDDDHVEVALGDPHAWMAPSTRVEPERRAEQVLLPLLREAPRRVVVVADPGTWGTLDDVRSLLAGIDAATALRLDKKTSIGMEGELRAEGAFIEVFINHPAGRVVLEPSHATRSHELVDDLVRALTVAAHPHEVRVRR